MSIIFCYRFYSRENFRLTFQFCWLQLFWRRYNEGTKEKGWAQKGKTEKVAHRRWISQIDWTG